MIRMSAISSRMPRPAAVVARAQGTQQLQHPRESQSSLWSPKRRRSSSRQRHQADVDGRQQRLRRLRQAQEQRGRARRIQLQCCLCQGSEVQHAAARQPLLQASRHRSRRSRPQRPRPQLRRRLLRGAKQRAAGGKLGAARLQARQQQQHQQREPTRLASSWGSQPAAGARLPRGGPSSRCSRKTRLSRLRRQWRQWRWRTHRHQPPLLLGRASGGAQQAQLPRARGGSEQRRQSLGRQRQRMRRLLGAPSAAACQLAVLASQVPRQLARQQQQLRMATEKLKGPAAALLQPHKQQNGGSRAAGGGRSRQRPQRQQSGAEASGSAAAATRRWSLCLACMAMSSAGWQPSCARSRWAACSTVRASQCWFRTACTQHDSQRLVSMRLPAGWSAQRTGAGPPPSQAAGVHASCACMQRVQHMRASLAP